MLLNFLLLMTNCTTDESSKKQVDQGSVEAKIWYNNHQKDYSAPILNYIKELQWQNAIITNGDVGEIIEVPFVLKDGLSVSTKMADLFNDHHRLMFVKNEKNEFNLLYVQIFTDEKTDKILDKNYNYYNLEENFDGAVYVQELATNTRNRLEFKKGAKIESSLQTAKRDERMCLYYGYWYDDGHFEPLVEMGCYGSPEEGGRDVPVYGGGGGGTPSRPTENPSCPEGYQYKLGECVAIEPPPPSCESFNFIQDGPLWQVAMVRNINFKVLGVSPTGIRILHVLSYPQAIYFGTPTNVKVGNTNITSGIAANTSARVLQNSMQEVIDKYGGTDVSDLILDQYFRERLKHNYPLSIPGGRVNFNSTSIIPATNYKTNTVWAGDCN